MFGESLDETLKMLVFIKEKKNELKFDFDLNLV